MTSVLRDRVLASPVDGVLILSGYGMRIEIRRGQLVVEDGVGEERRAGRFSKIDSTLKRVVIIGSSGSITLDAIQWLHDVGVPLIHIKADGTLLFVAARSAALDPTLRRQQATARETGMAGRIAEGLIRAKIEGQLHLLDRLPPNRDAKPTLLSALERLTTSHSLDEIRHVEAVAARYYWQAWRGVPLRMVRKDTARRPDYWQHFGTRVSPLMGQSPRKAVNPANAILNYLYAILEAEARIAALAVGADPMLGFLHTDQRRDSLALDLMEPVRPQVDALLLDLLATREFRKEDFFELRDGQCRLLPPLTHDLIRTAATWGRAVLPIAKAVAAQLTARQERLGSGRPRRGARVATREHKPVSAIAAGRMLDPRRSEKAGAKRRATMVGVVRGNKRWDRANGPTDGAIFKRDILPHIQTLPLKALMSATGLTKGACSRMRSGKTVPHPRHWASLRASAR